MSCKYDDFWFPVVIADNGTILQASNSFYLPQYKDDDTVQDFPDEFGLQSRLFYNSSLTSNQAKVEWLQNFWPEKVHFRQ